MKVLVFTSCCICRDLEWNQDRQIHYCRRDEKKRKINPMAIPEWCESPNLREIGG